MLVENSKTYPDVEESQDRWQNMSLDRLPLLISSTSSVFFSLGFIMRSAAHGWSLLFALPMAFLGFVLTIPLLAIVLITGWIPLNMIVELAFRSHRDKIYLVVRWIVVVVCIGLIGPMGVVALIDGWENNRFQPASQLYKQCMTPETHTETDSYKECDDGWSSSSIGRSGACSHHGGVVTRYFDRKVTTQPHTAVFCTSDSINRSWID